MKDENITPYDLPDQANHSFFFVDTPLPPSVEAPLHRHDAWELLCVVQGFGKRTAEDTVQDFAAGDIALIPPNMTHRWEFSPDSADKNGNIHYLMVAFKNTFVEQCMTIFPAVRNRLANVTFPDNALRFAVGFNDLPHFVCVFARVYGMPPARYRKSTRSKAHGLSDKAGNTE